VRSAPLLRRAIAFVLDAVFVASLRSVALRRRLHDVIAGSVVVDGRSP
jgi:uncharacterized RDD family membrane protein YckC